MAGYTGAGASLEIGIKGSAAAIGDVGAMCMVGATLGAAGGVLALPGAAIGALVSFATLVAYSDLPSDLHLLVRELRGRAFLFGLFAVFFAIGGWWSVRTWRRLWRRGRGPRERLIYGYGVRTMGVVTSAYVIVGLTWLGWKADSGALCGPLMTGGVVAAIFFGVPVCLHLGYF